MAAHFSSYVWIFTISLFISLNVCGLVKGTSFRFCHGGTWHEVTSDMCPYGVYFIEPVSTVCYYPVLNNSTDAPSEFPRIWRTPCFKPVSTSPNDRSYRALELEDSTITQRWGTFQFVQHLPAFPSQFPEWGNFTTLQECLMSCHGKTNDDYDDHESSDSVEDQITRIIPQLNETTKTFLTDQTLRLGGYLFDQLINQDMNPGPDLRIVRLFKKTMEIMRRTCQHPFVHNDFVTRVLYGFLFLVQDNGVGEVDDVTVEEYDTIMESLNVCGQTPPTFRLEGKACTMISEVDSVVHTDDSGNELTAEFIPHRFQTDERKFPYQTYDIIIESAWQAVQVVHGACFATFQTNANMHHRYTTAMEQLFGEKIMLRWRYPTQLIDPKLWGTWFLADVDSTYMNTIACVKASYKNAPFAMHLDRPIDWNRHSEKRAKIIRKRRFARNLNDPEEYWQNYQQTGGIVTKMLNKLRCFETQSERDEVFSNYRQSTCPDMTFDYVDDFGVGAPESNSDSNTPVDDANIPAQRGSGAIPPPPEAPHMPTGDNNEDKIRIDLNQRTKRDGYESSSSSESSSEE